MKIIKDVDYIAKEDRMLALSVLNRIRTGDRVFGSVAEGLKETLKQVEKDLQSTEDNRGKLEVLDNTGEFKDQIRLLKAGIKGEEELAEYFEKIVKYDEKLEDIICFASLSDPDQDSGNGDYISDSDFVAVYGNNILILDAKNIRTNPEMPIYLDGNDLVTVGGNPLLELHPSVHIWRNIFRKYNCMYLSIHGCVIIVNKTGACVWKNGEWYKSEVKPIHISELVNYLHEWIEGKEPTVNLSLLTTIAKMQIKKEGTKLDLSAARKRFKV